MRSRRKPRKTRGATAASTATTVWIHRIFGHRKPFSDVHGKRSETKLVLTGFADNQTAFRQHFFNHGRVKHGNVIRQNSASRGGRQSFHANIVLDRNPDARQTTLRKSFGVGINRVKQPEFFLGDQGFVHDFHSIALGPLKYGACLCTAFFNADALSKLFPTTSARNTFSSFTG